ncbi:MAG: hypothetical protein ACRD96_26780 [Bryobacteraceae bacterium]
MARLIINTLPARNSVTAFVADESGVPATGLGTSNFRLASSPRGADGAELDIAGVTACGLRGFYLVDFTHKSNGAPRRGQYIFELIVEKGGDRGEALASVMLG